MISEKRVFFSNSMWYFLGLAIGWPSSSNWKFVYWGAAVVFWGLNLLTKDPA